MKIPYVKHIQSNVKKGVCAELGPRTLIVGPNGSGKTSILNSLELALGGFATDVMGRGPIRKPGDLMVLSADGKTLDSTAELSNGNSATFSTSKTRTGTKRPQKSGPTDVAFPFLDVTANLTGSGTKARTWFLQRISSGLTLEKVIESFPKPLREEYRTKALLLQKIEKSFTQVDVLIALAEGEAKKGRESRSETKILDQLLDEMQQNVPPWPPTGEEIEVLKKEEGLAEVAYTSEARRSTGPTPAQVHEAWQIASDAVAQLGATEQTYSQVQEVLREGDSIAPNEKFYADIRRQLIPTLDLHIRIGAEECLVCGVGKGGFVERCHAFSQANENFDAVHEAEKSVEIWAKKLADHKSNAEKEIAHWQKLKGQEGESDPQRLLDLREAWQVLANQRTTLENQVRRWDEITRTKSRIEEGKEDEKKAKKMAKACQNAIKMLLQASIEGFEKSVQSYLPPTDTFGLEVDTKSDSCRFGLKRPINGSPIVGDDFLVSALSGAEWARTITAIGCATVHNGQLALFVPEERAFDPQTLRTVMGALEEAPGQVILTSTVHPDGENPNWTIIDLSQNG